ncbi:putative membrane protein [Haloferax volcanii]|nr:putative membrane protein [Haloferax lucentense]
MNPLLISPIISFLVAGIVFADAKRRGLARQSRMRWTVAVGFGSLSGFLCAFTFENTLSRVYFTLSGTPVVVQSPYELLTLLFGVGLGTSAMSVLAYGLGSRVVLFKNRS